MGDISLRTKFFWLKMLYNPFLYFTGRNWFLQFIIFTLLMISCIMRQITLCNLSLWRIFSTTTFDVIKMEGRPRIRVGKREILTSPSLVEFWFGGICILIPNVCMKYRWHCLELSSVQLSGSRDGFLETKVMFTGAENSRLVDLTCLIFIPVPQKFYIKSQQPKGIGNLDHHVVPIECLQRNFPCVLNGWDLMKLRQVLWIFLQSNQIGVKCFIKWQILSTSSDRSFIILAVLSGQTDSWSTCINPWLNYISSHIPSFSALVLQNAFFLPHLWAASFHIVSISMWKRTYSILPEIWGFLIDSC